MLYPDKKLGRVLVDQRTTNSVIKSATYAYDYDGSAATLSYPRRREDCRTRRRQENEKPASAGQAGCWTDHGGAECGKGYAIGSL
jgi:hypothetical protein